MKKVSLILAAILMLALFTSTCFASSNFIGGGIALKPMGGEATSKTFIGTISGNYFLLNDKLELGLRTFVSYLKPSSSTDAEWGTLINVFGQYSVFTWSKVSVGPRLDLAYTKNFISDYNAFALRAGIFVSGPLGDVGKIYGSVGTTLVDTKDAATAWKKYDLLGGIQFSVSDSIAIKAEIEFTQKETIFALQVGYTF